MTVGQHLGTAYRVEVVAVPKDGSLSDVARFFEHLRDLLTLLLVDDGDLTTAPRGGDELPAAELIVWQRYWRSLPNRYGRDISVARISYQSPLELLLLIGAGVGVATSGIHRLIRVAEHWTDFRVRRHSAAASIAEHDLVREAATVVADRLREMREMNPVLGEPVLADTAAVALQQIEAIRVEPA